MDLQRDNAVLQQKVELLQFQLKDSEERESNFKQMHETMIAALGKDDKDTNMFQKELDFASQLHDKEKEELR